MARLEELRQEVAKRDARGHFGTLYHEELARLEARLAATQTED